MTLVCFGPTVTVSLSKNSPTSKSAPRSRHFIGYGPVGGGLPWKRPPRWPDKRPRCGLAHWPTYTTDRDTTQRGRNGGGKTGGVSSDERSAKLRRSDRPKLRNYSG